MELEIEQYKYEKVKVKEKITFAIPETTSYYFETGIRRSIKIIPIWTNWNMEYNNKPEYIFQFKIVCVYRSFQSKIESFTIDLKDLEELYNRDGATPISLFVKSWIDGGFQSRTKEKFEQDFEQCLEDIKRESLS